MKLSTIAAYMPNVTSLPPSTRFSNATSINHTGPLLRRLEHQECEYVTGYYRCPACWGPTRGQHIAIWICLLLVIVALAGFAFWWGEHQKKKGREDVRKEIREANGKSTGTRTNRTSSTTGNTQRNREPSTSRSIPGDAPSSSRPKATNRAEDSTAIELPTISSGYRTQQREPSIAPSRRPRATTTEAGPSLSRPARSESQSRGRQNSRPPTRTPSQDPSSKRNPSRGLSSGPSSSANQSDEVRKTITPTHARQARRYPVQPREAGIL